jgi:fumarate reductase subunit C
LTPFARPLFQFLNYLAHFLLGRDWASYIAIDYLGIGAIAAIAFAIARKALRLARSAALLAVVLVIFSPAVLEYSIWESGFASESFAVALIGGVFLAALARRDALSFVLLVVALLVKETSVWAPFAAAATVLVRPAENETPRHRLLAAGAMVLPLVLWLVYRRTLFGGTGGSYATVAYSPFTEFLEIVVWKLEHGYRLFMSQEALAAGSIWASIDRVLALATYLTVAILILIWLAAAARRSWALLVQPIRQRRWPSASAELLVSLWAVTGLLFNLAVPLTEPRYAAGAIMFAWPAIVRAITGRRLFALRAALLACAAFSVIRMSAFVAEMNPPAPNSYVSRHFASIEAMNSALMQVPAGIKQVYLIAGSGLVPATPDYLRVFLGLKPEIIRVIDLHWFCQDERPFDLRHEVVGNVVTLSSSLPECATFFFDMAGKATTLIVDGKLRRSDTISYELPDAEIIDHKGPLKPALEPGRRIVAHIQTSGPARFIVQGPHDAITWFDTP